MAIGSSWKGGVETEKGEREETIQKEYREKKEEKESTTGSGEVYTTGCVSYQWCF